MKNNNFQTDVLKQMEYATDLYIANHFLDGIKRLTVLREDKEFQSKLVDLSNYVQTKTASMLAEAAKK